MHSPLRGTPRGAVLAVAASLAMLALVVLRPVAGADALAMGPLPACRYDDLLTAPRGYDAWATTLVDTILRVPTSYVPPDLVPVSQAGLAGTGQVRALVIDELRALAQAARAANAPISVESAYRSYADQEVVFEHWVARVGYARALKATARPGHSEHQLGLAIDFKADPSSPAGPFGSSAAGIWMSEHAWQYGFVMSYPAGDAAITCYRSEPWHFRYVGPALAREIHLSGLTPRAFLWTHFTQTVVPAVGVPAGSSAGAATAIPVAPTEPVASSLPSVPQPSARPPVTLVPAVTATPTPRSPAPPPASGPADAVAGVPPAMVVEGSAALSLGAGLIALIAVALRRRGRSP
jgi:zinc D-Ala-D-Ala carboxypeptidase